MNYRRKDIYRLCELFEIPNEKNVWDLMRKGVDVIGGKTHIFVKAPINDWVSVQSYEDDFGYGSIETLYITPGYDKTPKYKYNFFCIHGDNMNKFHLGINNAMLIYKFSAGEDASLFPILPK